MRRSAALLLCTACSSELVATVEIGLSEVPASVTSLTIVVRRGGEQVISATVPPSRASFELGVPAEIPLEFTVLARTSRPGPVGIGRMPAYVGRVVRSIPLAADATLVAMTLRPAGVLTVIAPPSDIGDGVEIRYESDEPEAAGVVLRAREEGFVQSYVVRAGTFRGISANEGLELDARGRIFVAREAESEVVLELVRVFDPPAALDLELPSVITPGDADVELTITASRADEPIEDPAAEVAWRVDSAPTPGALATIEGDEEGLVMGLPAEPISLVLGAVTRAWVHAEAKLESGEIARASQVAEVTTATSGPPVSLALRLRDADSIRTGTLLLLELVDANGAYAVGSTVTIDLSMSDPWIDLGGAPIAQITPRDRGRVLREISVPSTPRGLPVTLIATASSTVTGFVATATIAFPSR